VANSAYTVRHGGADLSRSAQAAKSSHSARYRGDRRGSRGASGFSERGGQAGRTVPDGNGRKLDPCYVQRFLGSEQNDTARRFHFGVNLPNGRTDTNPDRGTRGPGWFARDILRRNNRRVCHGGTSGVEATPRASQTPKARYLLPTAYIEAVNSRQTQVVMLHSNRGLTPLPFQYCPRFHCKVIANCANCAFPAPAVSRLTPREQLPENRFHVASGPPELCPRFEYKHTSKSAV
jgi:hypothetical protein